MPIIDPFKQHNRSLTSPPEYAAEVVPADTGSLDFATRALFVGNEGDLRVEMVGGGTVTFTGVPTGTILPLRVRRVYATGTTAGAIVGLW